MKPQDWHLRFLRSRADRIALLILSLFLLLGGSIGWIGHYRKSSTPSPTPPEHSLPSRQDSNVLSYQPQYYSWEREPTEKEVVRDSIIRTKDYVGAPERQTAHSKRKSPPQNPLDLNSADSTLLASLPQIGPTTARGICKYRELLGGYYTVLQLQEVYTMTPERFAQIRHYFEIRTPHHTHRWKEISPRTIPRHPYLNYQQARALAEEIQKSGAICSWEQIKRLGCFSQDDSVRLSHYFLF